MLRYGDPLPNNDSLSKKITALNVANGEAIPEGWNYNKYLKAGILGYGPVTGLLAHALEEPKMYDGKIGVGEYTF
jgi:hypothetical protein